jgi:hypothetical protein
MHSVESDGGESFAVLVTCGIPASTRGGELARAALRQSALACFPRLPERLLRRGTRAAADGVGAGIGVLTVSPTRRMR